MLKIVTVDNMIGRLGGDEFGILLTGSNAQNSFMLANKLLNTVQNYDFSWEERRLSIGISIGQVSWNEKVTSSEQLLSMADSACYMAISIVNRFELIDINVQQGQLVLLLFGLNNGCV